MPVFVEARGGRAIKAPRSSSVGSSSKTVRIALVNNMPDAALEDTETQFCELLSQAARGLNIHLKLVSLPNVPRGERGTQRLSELYYGIDELWNHAYDAVIVTGTEPKQADLKREPYWGALVELLDWAQRNTVSTVLSCLAAHAGVLHHEGIARVRLADKMFGVYEFANSGRHTLTSGAGKTLHFPHSRWNGLPPAALIACGYELVTRNEVAGADCFVKRKGNSLFVHFQGHPEYQSHTLFKEYRRDVKRFLQGERETYPTAPFAYFSEEAVAELKEFRRKVMSNPRLELMSEFPEALACNLPNSWHNSAASVYRNLLEFIYEKKNERVCYEPISSQLEWEASALLARSKTSTI